jgi:hypothetical protein
MTPGANRKKLSQSEPKLVTSLVMLMDSPSLKVQCQAALALRNLASDGMSCHALFSPNFDIAVQRNTSLRSSRLTVYRLFFDFYSQHTCLSYFHLLLVSAMSPFIRRMNLRSSTQGSCNPSSTFLLLRTTKKCNATRFRRYAIWRQAQRRISLPS